MIYSRTRRAARAAAESISFHYEHAIVSDDIQYSDARSFECVSMKNKVRAICIAGLMAVLAACGGSNSDDDPSPQDPPVQEPPPPPPVQEPIKAVATDLGTPLGAATTRVIGSAGGIIESTDGALHIEVPAGALAAEQVLSIQPISNHAHGKIGGAFRLGPEDVTFASPVRLTFSFTQDQIAGTSAELLRVASQNSERLWELHEDLTFDLDAGTVSIETNHFSDWSLVTGALLSPESATVKPGETVALSVVICERVQSDDLLTPLVAECRPSEVIRSLVGNWSVNGTPGGSGSVGTVSVQDDRSALYTAPAAAPQPSTVAVSAEYTGLQGELVMLVSNIRVQSGVCTPPSPGEPCTFDLVEFNGEALPYEGLPRETWENPEIVNSGRLSLRDSDGNGDGTWSLRIVWVEKRQAGDLEQFEQLAGDFTSDASGRLNFTVLGGFTFTGTIQEDTVTIDGYPFSTNNVSAPVQLKLQ